MRFWDGSAVVPLLVYESTTPQLMKLLEQDESMLVWWGTPVECVSAISRREREQGITTKAVQQSLERLKEFSGMWTEMQPVEAIKEMAIRLLRVHNLRSSDSLQLAAAILASEHNPTSLTFVSLDNNLSLAAQKEGFNLVCLDK